MNRKERIHKLNETFIGKWAVVENLNLKQTYGDRLFFCESIHGYRLLTRNSSGMHYYHWARNLRLATPEEISNVVADRISGVIQISHYEYKG